MVTLEKYMEGVRELELCFDVGNPMESENAVTVRSWMEALESCRSENWLEFLAERELEFLESDRLGTLLKTRPGMKREFDRILALTHQEIDPLVDEKTTALPLSGEDRITVSRFAKQYLVDGAMYIRFSTNSDQKFGLLVSGMILIGRFPCGWSGPYPDGTLFVY